MDGWYCCTAVLLYMVGSWVGGWMVRYVRGYFPKNLLRCNVFFSSSTTLKHSVFVHISSLFEARLKPIAPSVTWIPKPTTLEYLPCLYARAHGESQAISLTFTIATLAMKIAEPGCAIAGAHSAAVQRVKLRGSGAPDFSDSSKTRAKPTTYETISWLGWVLQRYGSFGDFSGEHGASERAQSAEWPKRDF